MADHHEARAAPHPAVKMVVFEGKSYTLDQFGFLDPPEQWDEQFAGGMARLQGIYDGLTPAHWDFINYIRRKFLVDKTIPLLVVACIWYLAITTVLTIGQHYLEAYFGKGFGQKEAEAAEKRAGRRAARAHG